MNPSVELVDESNQIINGEPDFLKDLGMEDESYSGSPLKLPVIAGNQMRQNSTLLPVTCQVNGLKLQKG